MNTKTILGIVIIGVGVMGTYLFSTQIKLPRTIADILIMVTLLGALIAGNSMIVFGRKEKKENH